MQKQKGISTLLGIIIIVVVAVVIFGGVFVYQYFSAKTNNQPQVQNEQQNKNQQQQTANQQTNNVQPINQTAHPSITIISPNGGETLKIGDTYPVRWSTVGSNSNDIYIALVENMGGVTAPCKPQIVKLTSNTGVYNWNILSEYSSDMCGSVKLARNQFKIEVSSRDASGRIVLYDDSDNYFSIVAPTNQTAGWKTYANTQYGFEIKYPTNSTISDVDVSGGRNVMINIPIVNKEVNLTGKVLNIKIATTQWNNGVEEPASCNAVAFFNYPTTSVVINGITFKKGDVSGAFGGMQGSSRAIEYCAMNNSKTFIITSQLSSVRNSSLPNYNENEESKVFEQIVSTFKFIK